MASTLNSYTPTPEEEEEFNLRYVQAVKREEIIPVTMPDGRPAIWCPQDGSQNDFMECTVFECLFHGTRGPGKTDGLLMSFAQHIGRGHGAAWRGIIFRQTYPQLADIQAKSEKWFKMIYGSDAKFNRTKMQWEWKTGEVLMFRHMARASDYWNYHGHEYPFIGWEELCNWAMDECFVSMIACCRSSTAGVPHMIRATTNSYGPGHNWVKERYRLYGPWWQTIIITDAKDTEGRSEPHRVSIYGSINENKILLAADPDYKQTIIAAATNPAMAEAWLHGSWDIVAGGMFDDVWSMQHNILPKFDIPSHWRIDRSFDWGSSAPFSVGWWATSDGSDLLLSDGRTISTVKGDLYRVAEWYGWTGRPNQGLRMLAVDVAKGIVEREMEMGWRTREGTRVQPGPADNSIHDVENGVSIALDMAKPVRVGNDIHQGIAWTRADKSKGSVKNGLEHMRKLMKQAWPTPGLPRELPGLFIIDSCDQFKRTVPNLARNEKDMDLVDDKAEDHICDESRYRVRFVGQQSHQGTHVGMY